MSNVGQCPTPVSMPVSMPGALMAFSIAAALVLVPGMAAAGGRRGRSLGRRGNEHAISAGATEEIKRQEEPKQFA